MALAASVFCMALVCALHLGFVSGSSVVLGLIPLRSVHGIRAQLCLVRADACLFQTPVIQRKYASFQRCPGPFARNHSTEYVRAYFWAFRSILLFSLSSFILVPSCYADDSWFFLKKKIILYVLTYFVKIFGFFYIFDNVICKYILLQL